MAVLGATFPGVCAPRPDAARSVGIARDLAERGVDLDVIRAGSAPTAEAGYLSAMKAGAWRIDLDGSVAGIVTVTASAQAPRRTQAAPKYPRRQAKAAMANPSAAEAATAPAKLRRAADWKGRCARKVMPDTQCQAGERTPHDGIFARVQPW